MHRETGLTSRQRFVVVFFLKVICGHLMRLNMPQGCQVRVKIWTATEFLPQNKLTTRPGYCCLTRTYKVCHMPGIVLRSAHSMLSTILEVRIIITIPQNSDYQSQFA